MFAQITCPDCNTMGQFSLLEGNYKGPYRCWKCKALYNVEIDNAKVISCQPMAETELEVLKAEQEAKKKGIQQPIQPVQAPKSSPAAQPGQGSQPSPSALPKAPFVWPPIPKTPGVDPKPAGPKADPKALPKAPFMWPPIPKPPPGKSGKS